MEAKQFETLEDFTDALSGLTNPRTIRLLALLMRHGRLVPMDASDATGLPISTVTYRLNDLHKIGILTSPQMLDKRTGFYELRPSMRPFIEGLLGYVRHTGALRKDLTAYLELEKEAKLRLVELDGLIRSGPPER